jgi:shikimate kinase
MGAGKTTVGRVLAAQLGCPFVDLDRAIEERARMSIKKIFETREEAWFRDREAEMLAGTAVLPGVVVSLGGGTFTFERNRDFISRHGVSIFLDVPFDVITERIAEKAAARPLFRSVEEARSLFEARLPCYKMANWVVDVARNESVTAVVARITDLLSARWEGV